MQKNRHLALAYAVPYAVYVAIASIPRAWLGVEANYALRLAVTAPAVVWAWRRYAPLRGPRNPWVSAVAGVAAGAAGAVAWIALLHPFVEPAAAWGAGAFWLRAAAAGLLVPVFEEYAMRGFVLRFVVQWQAARRAGAADPFGEAWDARSIDDVAPGAATWFAVAVSTVAFALGHAAVELPASLAYGLLMAGLWVWRRDLLSCVVAHAVTNVALAAWVRATGAWELW